MIHVKRIEVETFEPELYLPRNIPIFFFLICFSYFETVKIPILKQANFIAVQIYILGILVEIYKWIYSLLRHKKFNYTMYFKQLSLLLNLILITYVFGIYIDYIFLFSLLNLYMFGFEYMYIFLIIFGIFHPYCPNFGLCVSITLTINHTFKE